MQQTNPSQPAIEKTPTGFILRRDERHYEIKDLSKQSHHLRAVMKANRIGAAFPFEVCFVDFYSMPSRQGFATLCCKTFEWNKATVSEDLQIVIQQAEQIACATEDANQTIEMSDTDRTAAMALLRDPNLMNCISEDIGALGYIGEDSNKLLAYLVATSRKLNRPLSLLIESRSGAGKSALQDAVLALMPKEDCLKYTRMSPQSLFYKSKDGLEGKVLALEEATGMGDAAYSVRALQSSDALQVAVTVKDPTTGKMKTEENIVTARTAVMMTNTQPDFDDETKSRFICTTIDESAAATRAILAAQRKAHTLEGIGENSTVDLIKLRHQNAQRLLEPIAVANPHAEKLSFPTDHLLARRDNEKYLCLIDVIALLHQHQREKFQTTKAGKVIDYIKVTCNDIALANRIAQKVLIKHHDATPQGLQLFGFIHQMMSTRSLPTNGTKRIPGFTRRALREYTGWTDYQLRLHLTELVELEYLHTKQGRFGKEYVYEIDDAHLLEGLPGFGLTDAEALEKEFEQPDLAIKTANLARKSSNLAKKSSIKPRPREPRETLRTGFFAASPCDAYENISTSRISEKRE